MGFCPRCGKSIQKGQTFCDEHREVKLDLKPFSVTVCGCGRIKTRDRWFLPNDKESSILKTAKEHCKQPVTFRIEDLDIPTERGKSSTCKLITTYEGEEFEVACIIKNQVCDQCAKRGTQYFTAKLQLRDPPRGVLEFIESFLEPLVEKGIAINKAEDTPRGPDLYLTHKSAARHLGEKLIRKFGGTMKSSEQLFSRDKQTSKDLYRLNVLVQFPHFTAGDVVLLEGKAILITGLGKQCTGRDLQRDKKVVFTAGEEEKTLQRHRVTVTTTRPETAIIHPVTFQQVAVSNAPSLLSTYKEGQKATAVIANKKVYLL